jgi:methylmalonyl-CoA mutase
LARNIHHILKEESWMDAVVDPAAGSHYIEHLTAKLIDRAMGYCRDFDRSGGLVGADGRAAFHALLHSHRNALMSAYKSGSVKVIGANMFAPTDKRNEPELDIDEGDLLAPCILAAASHQTEEA